MDGIRRHSRWQFRTPLTTFHPCEALSSDAGQSAVASHRLRAWPGHPEALRSEHGKRTAQHPVDLHRPATLRHHPLPGQPAHPHAGRRPAVRRGGCVQPGVLPEPGVSAEPRQLSDRSVPQHGARQSQWQRPFPRQRAGAADHAAPRRPRLRLRAGRQAAHRLVLDRGGAARGRRLPGVRLQPVGHAVRRARQRVHRLAEPHRPPGRGDRHRRDGRRAQSRRPLPPRHTARTASDRLVRRPRHRVHRATAQRAVADEREHLRPARAVRRSPLLSAALPGQGPAARNLRRAATPIRRNGCAARSSSSTRGRRETSSGARRHPTTA